MGSGVDLTPVLGILGFLLPPTLACLGVGMREEETVAMGNCCGSHRPSPVHNESDLLADLNIAFAE